MQDCFVPILAPADPPHVSRVLKFINIELILF